MYDDMMIRFSICRNWIFGTICILYIFIEFRSIKSFIYRSKYTVKISPSKPLVISLTRARIPASTPSPSSTSVESGFKSSSVSPSPSSLADSGNRIMERQRKKDSTSNYQTSSSSPSYVVHPVPSLLNPIVLLCHICQRQFYGHQYLTTHLKYFHEHDDITVKSSLPTKRSSFLHQKRQRVETVTCDDDDDVRFVKCKINILLYHLPHHCTT